MLEDNRPENSTIDFPNMQFSTQNKTINPANIELPDLVANYQEVYDGISKETEPVFSKLYVNAKLPTYAHKNDACADIFCLNDVIIPGNSTKIAQTGIIARIPNRFELQIRPKSGLAKSGLFAIFGTIDQDYTGEIQVIIYNSRNGVLRFRSGEKIAQVSMQLVYRIPGVELAQDKHRSNNGFGSSGKC
jgi:dUTP pyrophosphatase